MPLLHGWKYFSVYSRFLLFIFKFVSLPSEWKTSLRNVDFPFLNPIIWRALHCITNATCLALCAKLLAWCAPRQSPAGSAHMLKDAHKQCRGGAEETHLWTTERLSPVMLISGLRAEGVEWSTHFNGMLMKFIERERKPHADEAKRAPRLKKVENKQMQGSSGSRQTVVSLYCRYCRFYNTFSQFILRYLENSKTTKKRRNRPMYPYSCH